MKSVVQKRDGRFECLNILFDDINEVERLEKFLRDAENSSIKKHDHNDEFLLERLKEVCQEILR